MSTYRCNATTTYWFGLLKRVRGSVLIGSSPISHCVPPHSQKPEPGCISNPFPGQSYSMHHILPVCTPSVPDSSRQGSALPVCQRRSLQSTLSSKPENFHRDEGQDDLDSIATSLFGNTTGKNMRNTTDGEIHKNDTKWIVLV